MRGFFFVRHGQSVANSAGISCGGDSDVDLTELGKNQAYSIARKLHQLGQKPCCLFAAPLKRTLNTAQIINQTLELDIWSDGALLERFLGDWNGQPSTITDKFIRDGMTPPNGESNVKFRGRVMEFFRGLSDCYENWPLIIGSRGTARILSEEFECEGFRELPNGGLVKVYLASGHDFRISRAIPE